MNRTLRTLSLTLLLAALLGLGGCLHHHMHMHCGCNQPCQMQQEKCAGGTAPCATPGTNCPCPAAPAAAAPAK